MYQEKIAHVISLCFLSVPMDHPVHSTENQYSSFHWVIQELRDKQIRQMAEIFQFWFSSEKSFSLVTFAL